MRKPLTFGAWNIRILLDRWDRPEWRTALIARMLGQYQVDIAALSETRFAGETQLEEVGGGYTFYCIGKPEDAPRTSGVGFAIRTKLARQLDSLIHGINNRLITLRLKLTKDCFVTVISPYQGSLLRGSQPCSIRSQQQGQAHHPWRFQRTSWSQSLLLAERLRMPGDWKVQLQWTDAAIAVCPVRVVHHQYDLPASRQVEENLDVSSVRALAHAWLRYSAPKGLTWYSDHSLYERSRLLVRSSPGPKQDEHTSPSRSWTLLGWSPTRKHYIEVSQNPCSTLNKSVTVWKRSGGPSKRLSTVPQQIPLVLWRGNTKTGFDENEEDIKKPTKITLMTRPAARRNRNTSRQGSFSSRNCGRWRMTGERWKLRSYKQQHDSTTTTWKHFMMAFAPFMDPRHLVPPQSDLLTSPPCWRRRLTPLNAGLNSSVVSWTESQPFLTRRLHPCHNYLWRNRWQTPQPVLSLPRL